MTGVVRLGSGARVGVEGDAAEYSFIRFRTADLVLLENRATCERTVVELSRLRPVIKDDAYIDAAIETDERYEAAKEKHDAVRRVNELGGGEKVVRELAAELQIHQSTLYRWLAEYEKNQLITSLFRKIRSDVGRTKLPIRVEAVMRSVIKNYHVKEERRRISQSYKEVERICFNKKLPFPSLDTFKDRLGRCPSLEMAEERGQRVLANKLRLNRGSIQGADYPYALIQIDHTRVDIQLVDGDRTVTIGRPWITVAIDVFSRMCIGFYVSFDPPGMLGTGLCLTHAILSKQKWMAKLQIDYDFPCQGIPRIVHLDNAKEFRGNTMKLVCELHGMSLQFRKVRRPQYGAHIERLMGTLLSEIHTLPGTTFSNVASKEEYDSEGRAVFTLESFERWLAHLILGEYHHRPHSGLDGLPPIVKHKKALLGEGALPKGELSIETDEETLYFDFLPSFKHSIQQYGVQIDLIKYSSDVLRRWVGARDPHAPTKPRKFIFRRDPRDISAVFFKDPETGVYHRIPYRNLANPHISVWELRALRKYLRETGRKDVDEEVIFAARNERRAIEMREEEATRNARKPQGGKPKKISGEERARRRRDASPQPEHGQAAEGWPQQLASKAVPQQSGTSAWPPGRSTEPVDDRPPTGACAPFESSERSNPKPDPFDEIEEF